MLHAHITKALDLTKDIHPLTEALTLQYLEASVELSFAQLYPSVEKDDNLIYTTDKWINQLRACILYDKPQTSRSDKDILNAKLEAWKALNKQ